MRASKCTGCEMKCYQRGLKSYFAIGTVLIGLIYTICQLSLTGFKAHGTNGGATDEITGSTRLPTKITVSVLHTNNQIGHSDNAGSNKTDNITTAYHVRDGNRSGVTGSTATVDITGSLITIVTAYFDLGKFQKGGANTYFTSNTYREWARTFAYLINPLVVYTDSDHFETLMRDIRQNRSKSTIIIRMSRNSSWAFQNNDRISRIFSAKSYPKHHPNTVVSEYACAQHAKYDVIARAARENYFHTDYFAWLDIGYFRDKAADRTPFKLELPPNFNRSLLSMNLIIPSPMTKIPEQIFKANVFWVGGGLFVGTRDLIIQYEQQFRRAVTYFLSQNLANTDQQVVYAMFSEEGYKHVKPGIHLQIYSSPDGPHHWFYLGYLMRKEIHIQ